MNQGGEPRPAEILIFEVADQRHGLPSAYVQELLPVVTLTPLPRSPAGIEGVMNLRGRVVPVLDIRSRLGLAPKPIEPSDHLIVARVGSRLLAIRVDRAIDLVQLEPSAVEEAQAMGLDMEHSWVAKLPDGLVPIHDLGLFLSAAESAVVDKVLLTLRDGPAQEETLP